MKLKIKKNKKLLKALKIIEKDHPDFSFKEACKFLKFAEIMDNLKKTIMPIPNKFKKTEESL